MRNHFLAILGLAFALASITRGVHAGDTAPAADDNPENRDHYASDDDRLDGDHLKLRVNVTGFEALDGKKDAGKCALKGTKVIVSRQRGEDLYVRFEIQKKVAKAAKAADAAEPTKKTEVQSSILDNRSMFEAESEAPSGAALAACDGDNLVNNFTQYKINVEKLRNHDFRRTGVMFGALIVPFKFYLGDKSKLSASSTIAPYVGFRGPAPFGLTFTPVLSAGLGLVPVANPATDESETKSAFSAAFGVLLTQSKNDKFNAGFLIGKDFLSKSDRASDPAVSKIWFSLYAGYKL